VLVGVYNTENNTVTLFPSLEDLVWLEFDSTQGKYTQGWEAKKTVLGTSTRDASISRPHSYLLEMRINDKYNLIEQ
jgi:hypothetical protein